MHISHLDHLVLTVADIQKSIAFYTTILHMTHHTFGDNRHALSFGNQKINVHPATTPLKPHALHPTPGSADLCFITTTPLNEIIAHLAAHNIPLELGPVPRTGAAGPLTSLYLRDPDQNLIELSNQLEPRT